jgi:predicted transcriptional regulator
MDKKQKEALVMALAEKGKTYREITKEAGVSPNTIKAVLNRAGLDESTSMSSRAFELYVKHKTPIEVAIELNLEAEEAIRLYHDYFKLLGITGFTQVYLQIKEDTTRFVNLFNLCQNAGMGDAEILQLLEIVNGQLPRVRLEYDRLKEEKDWLEAELNSWKAAVGNEVRVYQQFVDRNVALNNREDELQLSISELERKETRLNESLSEFQENSDINLEVKEEEITSMIKVLTQQPNMAIEYPPTKNNTLHYPPQVEPESSNMRS